MVHLPDTIASLSELDSRYPVLFCDVWGVLHNGETAFAEPARALAAARDKGITVVLLTNSPRPHGGVEGQLDALGVPPDAWDRIVTSGDVTRDLIVDGPRRIFHVGPYRDHPIFDGLDVELVEEFEADAVVCTGLCDDDTETPEDYAEQLVRLRARNLPFICANPDVVVERDIRRLAEPLDLKHVQTRAGVGEKFLYGPKHKDTTKPTIQRRIEKINEKWEKLEPEPGENIEQSELDKAKLEAKYWEDRYRKLARHFNIWFHRMRDQSRVIRAKQAEFGNIRNFNHKR